MRILFLDLDTLRPDHLGCYGYQRNTSPNIDEIADQAVRFNNYYCSDAPCLPSRTALMTGRFGIHTGVVNHGGTNADLRLEGEPRGFNDVLRSESLPGFLRSEGFRTVSISPFAERHSAWHFYAGFNEMYNTGNVGHESAEEITPTALKWIRDNARDNNWFLHINYWDAHTPYRAPESFGNPFENDPIPDWITPEILEQHLSKPAPHGAWETNMFDDQIPSHITRQPGKITDMKELRRMIDGYDCGIRYMDSHIGMLMKALEEEGVADDLAIIISADHGENQGELALYGEHGTADYRTCRIPMIIKWPGCKAGHMDNGLHYNLDLAPTLADLFGRSKKDSWDGRSYAPALKGEDCGRDFLVLSQCSHVCQRSVRFGPWIYMRTYHCGYSLFPDEMLFNIEEDPHEQVNLADERKDICMEAVYLYNHWHDNMMKTMTYDVDPLWTVMKEGGPFHPKGELPAYLDRLEKTGRGQFVEVLKQKYPGEFPPRKVKKYDD